MVKRLTLDQKFGVRIPVPELPATRRQNKTALPTAWVNKAAHNLHDGYPLPPAVTPTAADLFPQVGGRLFPPPLYSGLPEMSSPLPSQFCTPKNRRPARS